MTKAIDGPGCTTPVLFWNDMGQCTRNIRVVGDPDEVNKAVRLALRHAAAFIKVMDGGGVVGEFDPLEIMGLSKEARKR